MQESSRACEAVEKCREGRMTSSRRGVEEPFPRQREFKEEFSWAEEKPQRGKRREVSMRTILTMDGRRETGRGCKEEQMNRNRLGEEEGVGSSMQDTSFVSNDGSHGIVDQISGGPVHHDDGLEELGRTGDFSNWKTAVVKRDVERREEGLSPTALVPVVERRADESIDHLHK